MNPFSFFAVETIVGVVVGLVVLVAMVSGIAAVIFLRWRKQHRNIKKGVEGIYDTYVHVHIMLLHLWYLLLYIVIRKSLHRLSTVCV